ncbi:MAG: hypothetical protein GX046_08165, partial [Tissierellia bacterium]|nr:hypothetical protein [Tissierellia bacterium]
MLRVEKREGYEVEFDRRKISAAIQKAMAETEQG